MNSLVSAIITTHNRLDNLKKAINSVLNQTYKNIEIIVVDDASSDGTYEYCSKIKQIKYLRIEKDDSKGGNYARNLGIQNAKGDYIAFLDDDDEWLKEKTEKQVTYLNTHDCEIVYCNRIIDVNNGALKYTENSKNKLSGDCSKLIFYNIIGTTSTYMFKREIILNNQFDEKVKFWQEYDLITRIAQQTKIGYIDEPLIIYRQNINEKKKLTNNVSGWFENLTYLNNKYSSFISNLNTEENKKRQIMIYRDLVTRYSNLGDKKNKKKYLFKIYKCTHSLKDFIKYLLNLDRITYMKWRLKILKK